MTDSITRLEHALEAVRAAWDTEKAMMGGLVRVGYWEDEPVLRNYATKRAEFYAKAISDLQRAIEAVRAERRDRRSEVDKVAARLIDSVFPDHS